MKDKVAGKAQEIKGKVTGDKVEELKGKARQKVGGVKQVVKKLRTTLIAGPGTRGRVDAG